MWIFRLAALFAVLTITHIYPLGTTLHTYRTVHTRKPCDIGLLLTFLTLSHSCAIASALGAEEERLIGWRGEYHGIAASQSLNVNGATRLQARASSLATDARPTTGNVHDEKDWRPLRNFCNYLCKMLAAGFSRRPRSLLVRQAMGRGFVLASPVKVCMSVYGMRFQFQMNCPSTVHGRLRSL